MFSKILNRTLKTRVGSWDTMFSSVLRHFELEIIIPWFSEAFTHIALQVTQNGKNHTLFLPTLVAAYGALGSNINLKVAFERLQAFLMWLVVTNKVEMDVCKKMYRVQQRKRRLSVLRIIGEAQWDSANQLTPL